MAKQSHKEKLKMARKMMTHDELRTKNIGPFTSAWWKARQERRAAKEAAKRKKND